MKKTILFALLLVSTLLSAQQKMVIKLNDTTLVVPVWKVDNISFQDFQKPETSVPDSAVNLGLKSGLLWAPWNLGASSESEVGFLLGWGNPDSTNLSTDLKYFYAPSGVKNITNTEFDVAKSYWGDLWHMPTVEDFQELLTLDWAWDAEKSAYKVTNPEAPDSLKNNCIYFPITGKRFGEADADSLDFGFYWSGSIAENKDSAVYLNFPMIADPEAEIDMSLWKLLDGYRSRHLAVRPVYGEYKMPITITSNEATVAGTTATITITVEGEGTNIEYYLLYGKAEDPNEENAEKRGPYTIAELLGEAFASEVTLEGLDYETTYYYRALAVCGDNKILEEASHEFTIGPDDRIVNLGLSVKWASRNIGADTESDFGYYVAWGALSEIHYPYGGSGNISGNPDYDIARAKWGGEWRMPTRAEFEELKTYCTATQDKVNGVPGVRFSRGKYSIFLPFAGGRSGSTVQNERKAGYYWTSEGKTGAATQLELMSPIYDDFFNLTEFSKSLGYTVRAVYGKNDPKNFVENPDDINPEQGGGDEPGGDEPGGDEPGGDDPVDPPVNPVAEDVEAIDLGLTSGTLWANMNVGAKNSGEPGDFYAWGETETKDTYLLTNYSQYNGDYETFQSPYRGEKGIQGTEQDVAHIIWGGNWVMPSPTQFTELVEECNWEWTTQNGSEGYLVKSKKNSNSIFLPITGYYNGASRTAQLRGYYWTSSLYLFPADWEKAKQAMEFVIENSTVPKDMHYQMDTSRQYGLAIRPVILK